MNKLTNRELKHTDRSVIIDAGDSEPLMRFLNVPAIALKGKEDCVPVSEQLQTRIVDGGVLKPD